MNPVLHASPVFILFTCSISVTGRVENIVDSDLMALSVARWSGTKMALKTDKSGFMQQDTLVIMYFSHWLLF